MTALEVVPDGETVDPGSRHDPILERFVLGALMEGPKVRDAIAETGLTGGDFYRPAHEEVWDAIWSVVDRGDPADPIAVAAELTARGSLRRVGGLVALSDMVASVSSAYAAPKYARDIAADAALRRLNAAGARVRDISASATRGDVDDALDAAQAAVLEVSESRHVGADADDLGAAIDTTLDELENGRAPALPTGITDLDEILTGGLRRGTVTTIGARPGTGKTIVGLQIALQVAQATGLPVGYSSLEMSREDLLYRAYACMEGLDYQRLLKAASGEKLSESEWRAVARAAETLRASNLTIPDRDYASVASIRADIRRAQKTHGECALWVVDYLQLMTPADTRVVREQQIAGIMRGLKQTARSLGTPLLLLAQLSRDGVKAARPPIVTDLRESGSIEQDSDNVILLHRDPDPDENAPKAKGDGPSLGPDEILFLVPKNRRGPQSSFVRLFEGHHQRIGARNWAPHHAGASHWADRGQP